MLTGEIPEFTGKNESSEVVDIFGDCTSFPNIISKLMLKMKEYGQRSLSSNQLSTLSLCKCVHPICVLIFFFECFNKFCVSIRQMTIG